MGINNQIYESLTFTSLDTFLYIKGFIKGEEKCNYEIILLELLNNSPYFMKKTGGQLFTMPISESDFECDANTNNYSIDFKLFIGTSMARAKKNTSESIINDNKSGWVSFGAPRDESEYTAIRIMQAFRSVSYNQLVELSNKNQKELHGNYLESDIYDILKKIEYKKNLLFFYPFNMECQLDIENSEVLIGIKDAFTNDLTDLIKYRNNKAGGHETYFSTVYKDALIIFLFENIESNELRFVESIELNNSQTYNYLTKRYASYL